jgi:3-oxoacyl-[acyl-carrier protein] reductase
VATFGRLDVLVNNAGTVIPKRFEETTLEEMDRVIDINVRGTFVATQASLKHMQSGGRIIMIGSSVGEPDLVPGLVPYSAAPTDRRSRRTDHGSIIGHLWTAPVSKEFPKR